MPQISPAPSTAPTEHSGAGVIERMRSGLGRRFVGIAAALLIEALLILLLLTLGSDAGFRGEEQNVTVVDLEASEQPQAEPEEARPEPAAPAEESAAAPVPETTVPQPPTPVPPAPVPVPRAVIPTPYRLPPPAPAPTRPAPRDAPVYGPANTGQTGLPDTARVGTAPNGQPLYAAAWYREPRDDELAGYLSTANGPGWGLIACRTAPGFRVEDCVGLDEYPAGSQITRAVLAAAWQFRVRPPRLGGQPQVGSWVRIRIDYGVRGP